MSVKRHARITGSLRDQVRRDVVARYQSGNSIDAIANDIDRSYGFVHRLLGEAEVTMRPRGGGPHNRRQPHTDHD